MSGETDLSLIIPCYNEQDVILETHRRICNVVAGLKEAVEIIYVDDGSRDCTIELLRGVQSRDARVRVLSFSRNFGHQIAVTAGIDVAMGKAAVILDADLQDPPELIPQMLSHWREGYDVVYGKRTVREGETWFKRLTATCFYHVLNMLSEVPIPLDTGDFRLVSRRVLDAMKEMPEYDRFIRGMVSWTGFRQVELPYTRAPRLAGQSKYPLWKMALFAADGIVSFSILPLRFATWLGITGAAAGALGIVYALVLRLFTTFWVSGWTMLFIAVLFIGGVQLLMLGILGEYVGRIYRSSKRRPLYVLAETLGVDQADTRACHLNDRLCDA